MTNLDLVILKISLLKLGRTLKRNIAVDYQPICEDSLSAAPSSISHYMNEHDIFVANFAYF